MSALPRDMNAVVGAADIVLITLDSLRYDVAQAAFAAGELPTLAAHLPPEGWERRHTPGTFTLAAHQAFFSGFLPTPLGPHPHPRPFACAFGGSVSIGAHTAVFDAPDIVHGLAGRGYHTACIGGTGFFNPEGPLGWVLPSLFAEAHWEHATSVFDDGSAARSVALAVDIVRRTPGRLFLFVNFAAVHKPTIGFLPGATEESPATQRAALATVDAALGPLFEALRPGTFVVVCADHGTTHGEDGYWGHRLAHPLVWDVPYAEWAL